MKQELDEITTQIEQMQNIGFESTNKIEKINSEIGISKERIQNNITNKERLKSEIKELRIKNTENYKKKKNKDKKKKLIYSKIKKNLKKN